MLNRKKSLIEKDVLKFEVTINIPRYISFDKNTKAQITCSYFDFNEEYLFLAGRHKVTLKRHGDGVYLIKQRLKEEEYE